MLRERGRILPKKTVKEGQQVGWAFVRRKTFKVSAGENETRASRSGAKTREGKPITNESTTKSPRINNPQRESARECEAKQ